MRTLAWILAAGAMVMATGCAGESAAEDDSVAGGEESALAKATVGSAAVALEIHTIPMTNHAVKDTTITVAGTKLSKVTRALKRRPASDPVPRCMPGFRRELRFLDAKGNETSKGSISCGGIGQLQVGDKSIAIKLADGDDTLTSVAEAPLVPEDVLWGITEVEISKPGRNFTKKFDDADDIAELVSAIDGDQEIVPIDPHAPVARCLPSFVLKYMRGAEEAAWASFNCGSGPKVTAHFGFDDKTQGTVEVATKAVQELSGATPE